MYRTKTEQLDAHFALWRQQTRIARDKFHPDGIIDEAAYTRAKVKLCFLMKEPNNMDGDRFDFRTWWKSEVKYQFSHRLSEWAAGVRYRFPPYDTIQSTAFRSDRHQALCASALVNVKKSGGGGSSKYHSFMHALGATEKQQEVVAELVREELRIIDPQVVVMGLSWKGLRQRLFPDVTWKPSGYDLEIGEWEGRTLIDFSHPSARTSSAAVYCLLEKVMGKVKL
jgi:hypothetical protein